MKVLHVISDKNIGGAGVLLCNLLTCFDRERIQSIVALPCGSRLAPRILQMNIPVFYLSEACDRISGASVRELMRIIKRSRADIVHTNAAVAARVAAKLCGVPVLHTRHCCFPPSGILTVPVARSVAGICNRMLSDHVIATAEAAADNLRALGIPARKISVIINGSLPIGDVDAQTLCDIRKSLDIRAEDFTVGICARLEECKGHDTFLQAATILKQSNSPISFRFLLVGEGSLRKELEDRVASLGLGDLVRFTGFVSNMAPIYHLLRVNVNCSCGTETSCLAISEGMSVGLPTIASDYGGNGAMIGNDGAGILFPVGDAVALANAILQIAQDREMEENMRLRARQRYKRYYTAEKMSLQVQNLYEKLAQKSFL